MSSKQMWLANASLLAVALAPAPAFAAGTQAGTTITNSVTVDYAVGGVAQNQVTASNSFTVDRKVVLTVAELGTGTTTVSPGQSSAVTSFTVTNSSNATLDFALSAVNRAGGLAAHGGSDSFDVSNLRIYRDTNANGVFDSASDTQITYLDQLSADATVTVFVVADVPLGRSTNDVAGVRLSATAHDGSTAGTQGSVLVQTAGADTAGMDTVFADSSANGNTASDGIGFAEDDYTILAANVSATKLSRVVRDPVNGTVNPKNIPGSVVEYCINVSNASGGATATNVVVTDVLPAETTYDSTFGIKVGGTVTSGVCNADGAGAGAFNAGTVSGTITSLPASESRTVLFRATIN
ncbi:hypothetical protein ACFQPG_10895 [Sphingomonas sp. GCM10030256]|uniref:hypothetical protein n=1 Tax=Sphingomonas sp. GCM10030256 TaxID=3273427 RepID=UPI00361D4865